MKKLADQLCDLIDEYLSITADHPGNVVGYLMMITGGQEHVKGDGVLSEAELAKRDPGSITGYERYGSYKVSHLREWLNYLCYEFGMLDVFLVPSLIKHYQQFLINLLLDEEVVERRRKIEQHLESMLKSKELRDDFFESLKRYNMPSKPTSEEGRIARIKELLDSFRKMPLESINRKRDKLRVWEEKIGEMASEENISKYLSEIVRNEYFR